MSPVTRPFLARKEILVEPPPWHTLHGVNDSFRSASLSVRDPPIGSRVRWELESDVLT